MADAKLTGPRGGKTTRSETGAVRKTFWLEADVAEALRKRAFEEDRPATSIVHDALRRYLEIED